MISSKIYLEPLNVPFTPQDKLEAPPCRQSPALTPSAAPTVPRAAADHLNGAAVMWQQILWWFCWMVLDAIFLCNCLAGIRKEKTKVTVYYTYILMEGVYTCDMRYTNMFHCPYFSGGFICQSVDKVEGTVKHVQCIGSIYPPFSQWQMKVLLSSGSVTENIIILVVVGILGCGPKFI